MDAMQKFISLAAAEARKGMRLNHGGPFGAVIVQNGRLIARAHNRVLKTNDPTAHAEMLAIRRAAKKLGRFDLSDCEIYSSCEPCPMCFAAIHWAKIPRLYYGCSHQDAAEIGFDDAYIYDVIRGRTRLYKVHIEQLEREQCRLVFEEWRNKSDRKTY
jgi:guanine deaminase